MTYIWLFNLLTVFLLSIILSGIVIPEILLIAFRRRLFDEVNERKIHHCSVPRLGGIAFKPVIFVSMALILGVNVTLGRGEFLNAIEVDDDALPRRHR
jgi:UDP-N-acetylmuramyl pentapeptide phosphotransferase/UDP-N-acetylglucosamine-1-phosphate transferase